MWSRVLWRGTLVSPPLRWGKLRAQSCENHRPAELRSTLLDRVEAVTEQIHVCRLSGSALTPVLACGAAAVRSRVFPGEPGSLGWGVSEAADQDRVTTSIYLRRCQEAAPAKNTLRLFLRAEMKTEFYFMLLQKLEVHHTGAALWTIS